MIFDIAFIDITAYKPYDGLTLATEGLGGTEASLIRLAETLARFGASVAVFEKALNEVSEDRGVFYLPLDMAPRYTAKAAISLRGYQGALIFPGAAQFSWQHDLPTADLAAMQEHFLKHDVTVVTVSEWHKEACRPFIPEADLIHIYNPVGAPVVPRRAKVKYDKDRLVWTASPHKGLLKALELFETCRKQLPSLTLHVYNPGYLHTPVAQQNGVVYHGVRKADEVWQAVSESLCVFYPCQFDETFGLIVAEANNVHTPVLTYERAALVESVSTKEQLVPQDDEKAFVERLVEWYNGARPEVYAQARFAPEVIAQKWLQLIEAKKQK